MLGMVSNTSNPIYTLSFPGRKGVIGMTPCPGVRLESARRGNTAKNMKRDLAACREWGASGIVTLNQPDELRCMGDRGQATYCFACSWRTGGCALPGRAWAYRDDRSTPIG